MDDDADCEDEDGDVEKMIAMMLMCCSNDDQTPTDCDDEN